MIWHTASRRIIDLLVEEGIEVLVIGKNPLWKQAGTRIVRSWYRVSDGTIIHVDISGGYNILRKSSSDLLQLGRGVAGAAVRPRRLAV